MTISRRSASGDMGVTSVEYALIAVLVAAVIAATVLLLGQQLPGLYDLPWPL